MSWSASGSGVYARDGELETVRIVPCPMAVLPDQLAYIGHVSLTIQNALKRLPEMYMADFAVREILELTPEEDRWLWDCRGPSQREHNPIFGRLDAVIDFTSAMWKDSLKYVEPNLSGIGGLHMVPACDQIVAGRVLPALRSEDPAIVLEVGADIRQLLMQEVLDHLEAIGRSGRNLCFVEPKYDASGPDEQEDLARYFHDRHGMRLMHADPAELELSRGGDVTYEGAVVDVAYRDYAVLDLVEAAGEGVDVAPMKALLKANRVISSIAAELDQKSCWEILTDALLTQRYFNAEERHVFRRHVLWTRVLSARKTSLPTGESVDLLEYARRGHESLVLKPNRSYGGEGVVVGTSVTRAEWESAVEGAIADREQRWVVQQLATLPVHEFPVLGPGGEVHPEPFYAVMGFAPSQYGVAVLARVSQRQVVNVAQRGGMCSVLVGRPIADPLATT